MKTMVIVLGSLLLAAALLVAGFAAGAVWAQSRVGLNARWNDGGWMGPGMMGLGSPLPDCGAFSGPGMMGYGGQPSEGGEWMGPGMMGYGWRDRADTAVQDAPCTEICVLPSEGSGASPGEDITSLEDVEASVREYVQRLGYTGLEVKEVMEFDLNYYAIVAEEDTGIGAMELLVGKESGVVGPEPGPNMMWNAKYGMHGLGGGMMGRMGTYPQGGAATEMSLSPQEAEERAQRWLDANLPGREAGEADAFYGYYTLHFLNEGQVEGMLSIHGRSGDVWYHSWHGDFVAMSEDHG